MTTYKILKEYKAQYENPIVLELGEKVHLGEEEKEEKWKGWRMLYIILVSMQMQLVTILM